MKLSRLCACLHMLVDGSHVDIYIVLLNLVQLVWSETCMDCNLFGSLEDIKCDFCMLSFHFSVTKDFFGCSYRSCSS
ncbi:unnamed protein product [Camellia sinensis]